MQCSTCVYIMVSAVRVFAYKWRACSGSKGQPRGANLPVENYIHAPREGAAACVWRISPPTNIGKTCTRISKLPQYALASNGEGSQTRHAKAEWQALTCEALPLTLTVRINVGASGISDRLGLESCTLAPVN